MNVSVTAVVEKGYQSQKQSELSPGCGQGVDADARKLRLENYLITGI